MTATLLKDALTSLAKQIGMQIIVLNISGRVVIKLKSQALPKGIDFTLDKNETLVIEGYDEGYYKAEWDKVSTLAQNYIKAYKVTQNARNNVAGARVNVKIMQKQVILEVVA